MIRYYKLFDLLNRRGMKKTDLLEVISAPTLAKLSSGANIQTNNIDKICLFLNCQPGDIMEVVMMEQKGLVHNSTQKKYTEYATPKIAFKENEEGSGIVEGFQIKIREEE